MKRRGFFGLLAGAAALTAFGRRSKARTGGFSGVGIQEGQETIIRPVDVYVHDFGIIEGKGLYQLTISDYDPSAKRITLAACNARDFTKP